MKINDVRVLRNIIGDKAMDDDGQEDILKRKLPVHEMKKLELGRLPQMSIPGVKGRTPLSIAKDMAGKNKESISDPDTREEAINALGGKAQKKPITINVDTEQSKRQEEMAQMKADEAYHKQKTAYLKEKAQAEILEAYTKPRTREPTSRKIFQKDGKGGISIPTMAGIRSGYKEFQKVAGPMTERLSYSAGGAVMGEFGDEASGRKVNMAINNRQQYIQYLTQKYMKKGYRISSEADLYSLINYKEKQRINELSQVISKSQNLASNKGFLSGSGGSMVLERSRTQAQNANIPLMTMMGKGSTPVGSFSSETLSRLGVLGGLKTSNAENKWGIIFDENKNSSTDKITQIIGKSPQPVPVKSKIHKYIKVLDSEKMKKFI